MLLVMKRWRDIVVNGCISGVHPRTRERWRDTVKGEVERHRRDWGRGRWRDTVVIGQGRGGETPS